MLILNDKPLIKPITDNDIILLKKYYEETQSSKNLLEPIEKKYVHYYLKNYIEWRELLLTIEEDNERLKPINNTNYKGKLKRLGSVAAIFIIFFAVPQIDTQFKSSVVFKGAVVEKGIIDESIEYWEKLFDKWFGGDEG